MTVTGMIEGSFRGLATGFSLDRAKRAEDSMRAGRNFPITGLLQLPQVEAVTRHACRAFGEHFISPLTSLVLQSVPLLVSFALYQGIEDVSIRETLLLLHDHLGTLCQLAALVTSVALIAMGELALGGVSLAALCVGWLSRYHLLPQELRAAYVTWMEPISRIATIFYGGFFSSIFSILECASLLFDTLFPNYWELEDASLDKQLTGARFQSSFSHFTMDRSYATARLKGTFSRTDSRLLLKSFDDQVWDAKDLRSLKGKMAIDSRMRAELGQDHILTDQEYIARARSLLETFVTEIVEHRIGSGEPAEYLLLEQKLSSITDKVIAEGQSVCAKDMLLRLAVEGGEYCGPGKIEVVDDIFVGISAERQELTPRERVLEIFHGMRVHDFDNLIGLLKEEMERQMGGEVVDAMDISDIHYKNTTLNLYATRLRIQSLGAKNDILANASTLSKLLVNYFLGEDIEKLEEAFWGIHERDAIMRFKALIGTASFSKDVYFDFWRGWIQRELQEYKEDVIDELADKGSILGRHLFLGEIPNPRLVHLMLADMGIGKIH